MSARILQVNFRFNVPRSEFEQMASSVAPDFARLPGLRWKIWLMNEEEEEAGGIYVFEDEASLKAYLDGPLASSVMSNPALSNLSVKVFDSLDEISAVTRGPVEIGESV